MSSIFLYQQELVERIKFFKYKQKEKEINSYKNFVHQLKCSVIVFKKVK